MRYYTLVELMNQELAGKGKKDTRTIRQRWHSTAKRYLRILELTSDPINPIPQTGDRVVPVPGFFLRRPASELFALYRASKTRTAPVADA